MFKYGSTQLYSERVGQLVKITGGKIEQIVPFLDVANDLSDWLVLVWSTRQPNGALFEKPEFFTAYVKLSDVT